MIDGNTGEGGFYGVWNRLLSIFNKGKDEVVRSSKVSKVRLDLSSLKKEREKVFERLGEEIYNRQKGNKISLPGLDSYLTEIDLITFKISSKERELKGLKGEEVQESRPASPVRPERRERPYRPRERRPHHVRMEGNQETSSLNKEEVKAETTESDNRPRRRHYRPKRRPPGAKQEVKSESGSN